jgi:serine/threonine-protein kinase HipA
MDLNMPNSPIYKLDVNYGNTVVGTLGVDSTTNLLTLSYTDQWRKNGFAISPHLPLNIAHSIEAAYNYIDNALPEGEARKLLAESLGVSQKNVYSQVRAIGIDVVGAMTFGSIDKESANQHRPSFRLLEEKELIDRLDNKEELGLLTWDDKPRLSVAGVQDKLNVFIDAQGKIGFGDGSICSSHILKFEKKNCPQLVLNEFFCMKLSSAVGLPTADVKFIRFGSHPSLIVTRFDRKYVQDNDKVMRRHVIDGCQALNLPRDYKYERNLGDGRDVKHVRDGASLKMLFEFCQLMSSPVESKQWLINWQLFNLMINNYDSHGKNVSLFFDRNQIRFTPAYDLVNIAMFNQFQDVLAMAMGEEFEPNNIHAYQLADFAETCKVDKKLLSRSVVELANKIIGQLETGRLIDSLRNYLSFTGEDFKYFDQLSNNILIRTKYLQEQAEEIPRISV